MSWGRSRWGWARRCCFTFLARNAIGAVRAGDRGFFMRAGAFAGVFGLLCHGLWDVPVHRWGTAAFGIALLAIACPPLHRRRQIRLGRLWAGAPLLIGLFWLLPFLGDAPDWSPYATRQLLDRLAYSPTLASLGDLQRIERWFPARSRVAPANRHPGDDRRASPGAGLARVPHRGPALPDSIGRCPRCRGGSAARYRPACPSTSGAWPSSGPAARAPEIFVAAYRKSRRSARAASAFWRSYARGHPEFLLCYAEMAPSDEQGKAAYDEWWKVRGDSSAGIDAWEPAAFYAGVRKWGDRAQLEIWMNRQPELESSRLQNLGRHPARVETGRRCLEHPQPPDQGARPSRTRTAARRSRRWRRIGGRIRTTR